MEVSAVSEASPRTAPRPRRTQEQRRAATREAILKGAAAAIAEIGIGAGVRGIAERAGVSRGALQHHFPSRDDLLLAVLGEEIMADLNLRLDIPAIARLPLAERIDALLAHYYGVYASPIFKAVLIAAVDATPGFAERLDAVLAQAQNMINRVWREVFFDVAIEDEALASLRRVVMGALRGYALRQRLGELGNWPVDRRVLARMLLIQLAPDADG
jgi:AcrR family transcriptional regulator